MLRRSLDIPHQGCQYSGCRRALMQAGQLHRRSSRDSRVPGLSTSSYPASTTGRVVASLHYIAVPGCAGGLVGSVFLGFLGPFKLFIRPKMPLGLGCSSDPVASVVDRRSSGAPEPRRSSSGGLVCPYVSSRDLTVMLSSPFENSEKNGLDSVPPPPDSGDLCLPYTASGVFILPPEP